MRGEVMLGAYWTSIQTLDFTSALALSAAFSKLERVAASKFSPTLLLLQIPSKVAKACRHFRGFALEATICGFQP